MYAVEDSETPTLSSFEKIFVQKKKKNHSMLIQSIFKVIIIFPDNTCGSANLTIKYCHRNPYKNSINFHTRLINPNSDN